MAEHADEVSADTADLDRLVQTRSGPDAGPSALDEHLSTLRHRAMAAGLNTSPQVGRGSVTNLYHLIVAGVAADLRRGEVAAVLAGGRARPRVEVSPRLRG